MYTLSMNMWFQKLIRQFFFNLDKVVYGFISTMYDLLISIARTSVLSQADIINMADKIYKLLAVFMVFKVTFSLIMYVVNPDDFSDKSKGVSKLGLNIIISLALLILTPYMFSAAFRLQTIVLEDNSLAELIMGNGNDEKQNSSFLNDAGDTIAFYSIQPFFLPNVSLEGLEVCVTLEEDGKFNETCESALKKVGVNDTLVNNYKYGIENQNMGLTFRQDLVLTTDKGNDTFVMEYRFILSTVLGVVIVLILITFCMDVALRSIKLSFLQLIAPIPIISYVDPKSGKDGMFKKWYQMCFKTYLSLFLRLIALYFAIYIINRVGKLTDIVDGSQVTNGFIKIFIIIGALMFAKQLPKILEGLGVKLDGGFKLNPLKKFEEEALGGKKIAGFAKGAVGAGLAGAAAFGTNLIAGKGNVLSAFAGGVSASTRGLRGALKGEKFGKNFTNSYSAAMKARTSRADRQAAGVGWIEMQGDRVMHAVGMHTTGETVKTATDTANKISSVYSSMMGAAEGNDKATFSANVNGQNRTFDGIKGLNQFIDEVKKTQINRNDYSNETDYLNALQEQQNLISSLDDLKKARLNDIAAGRATTNDAATDSAIRSGYSQMQELANALSTLTSKFDSNIASIPSGADAKTINGMAKGVSSQIVASQEASHATTVDQYAINRNQK